MQNSKTFAFLIVAFIAIAAVTTAISAYEVSQLPRPTHQLGAAGEWVGYSAVLNSAVTCPSSTSTLIDATNTARTSFMTSDNSTNSISICKGPTCTFGSSGIIVNVSTTGNNNWEQTDSYSGPYSCIAANASSSLGVSKSP